MDVASAITRGAWGRGNEGQTADGIPNGAQLESGGWIGASTTEDRSGTLTVSSN